MNKAYPPLKAGDYKKPSRELLISADEYKKPNRVLLISVDDYKKPNSVLQYNINKQEVSDIFDNMSHISDTLFFVAVPYSAFCASRHL